MNKVTTITLYTHDFKPVAGVNSAKPVKGHNICQLVNRYCVESNRRVCRCKNWEESSE